jgi:DNA-binding NarL/FixJ family response regulator
MFLQHDDTTSIWPWQFSPVSGIAYRYEPSAALEPTEARAASVVSQTRNQLVLVVEDQEFLRVCLVSWLRCACPDIRIACADGCEDLHDTQLSEEAAAVIISETPLHQGAVWLGQQVKLIHTYLPQAPIIAIASPDTLASPSVGIGLHGYIPTSTTTAVASAAIRLVIAGGTYLPHIDAQESRTMPTAACEWSATLASTLSPRERAVADRVGRGMQNKVIAYELDMSLSTVKAHVHCIIKKLGVRNRTEIAVRIQSASNG